jgi:hypothetical protein
MYCTMTRYCHSYVPSLTWKVHPSIRRSTDRRSLSFFEEDLFAPPHRCVLLIRFTSYRRLYRSVSRTRYMLSTSEATTTTSRENITTTIHL